MVLLVPNPEPCGASICDVKRNDSGLCAKSFTTRLYTPITSSNALLSRVQLMTLVVEASMLKDRPEANPEQDCSAEEAVGRGVGTGAGRGIVGDGVGRGVGDGVATGRGVGAGVGRPVVEGVICTDKVLGHEKKELRQKTPK